MKRITCFLVMLLVVAMMFSFNSYAKQPDDIKIPLFDSLTGEQTGCIYLDSEDPIPYAVDGALTHIAVSVKDSESGETVGNVYVPADLAATASAFIEKPSKQEESITPYWAYSEVIEITLVLLANDEIPQKIYYEKAVPGRPGSIASGWLYHYGTASNPSQPYKNAYYRGSVTAAGPGA